MPSSRSYSTSDRDHNRHRRDNDRHHNNTNNNNQHNHQTSNNNNNTNRHHHHHDTQRRQREDDDSINYRQHHRHGRNDNQNERDRVRHQQHHDNHREIRKDHHYHNRRQLSPTNNNNNNNNKLNNDDGGNGDGVAQSIQHHNHRFVSSLRPRDNYRCHICTRAGHWVVQCPILNSESFRKFFPHMSVSKGCGACGKKTSSHDDSNCPNNNVKVCQECGGLHVPASSKSNSSACCPFARSPSVFYEFVDEKTGLPYYVEAEKKKAFQQMKDSRDADILKRKKELLISSMTLNSATSVEATTTTKSAIFDRKMEVRNNDKDDDDVSTKNNQKEKFEEKSQGKLLEEIEQELLRRRMSDVEEEQKFVTWSPPQNPGDVIYWFCEKCSQLLPAEKYRKCPNCRTARFR